MFSFKTETVEGILVLRLEGYFDFEHREVLLEAVMGVPTFVLDITKLEEVNTSFISALFLVVCDQKIKGGVRIIIFDQNGDNVLQDVHADVCHVGVEIYDNFDLALRAAKMFLELLAAIKKG